MEASIAEPATLLPLARAYETEGVSDFVCQRRGGFHSSRGYKKGAGGRGSGNSRNRHLSKTVLTEEGGVDLSIPRDRAGTFEPQLMPNGVTRIEGFDDKIVSLYARGLTVGEIQGHLKELYGAEVSADLISRVTGAVLEEEWQARPLNACDPVVFFNALRVKVRDEGLVRNKAVSAALALDAEGQKHVLGHGSSRAKAPSSGSGL